MTGARFHPLTVARIEPLTDEAVAITFDVPPELDHEFRWRPGQHVTVRATIDGEDVRRSYSICADPATGPLRIGVKRLDGGVFSTYATKELQVGDVLEVGPPVGEFVLDPDPSRAAHYGAVAAGSGITPILSMVTSVLRHEPESRFTLLFGNRDGRSIMFLEELEGLKDRYPDRFQLVHVLSREPSVIPLFSGRIDAEKLRALLATIVDPSIDEWFLCGPYEMVEDARSVLEATGLPADRIHDELFFAAPLPERAPEPVAVGEGVPVTFTLDGRTATVMVPKDGAPIIDYVAQVRPDVPWSCRAGMCMTCRAKVVEGSARLDRNFALTPEELEQGYVLTCQAHPVSDAVELSYDEA
ncbi:MAG TPA: phenylacetate-CoA oxygenase/reductase subunit PaaK [Actinobacteria bacterium]|nr:phenylacetate-CoA oxygenase/reductase subunit PaaK [Actinomycetota bacterium]